MIEIEKKFLLNATDKEHLLRDAVLVSERAFTDVYFDTDDYALTKKDTWLRTRDGKFELKIPLQKEAHGDRTIDRYDEVEDEKKILEYLKIAKPEITPEILAEHGYKPFCVCVTERRKYKTGEFTIDVDMAKSEGFRYEITEIEMMVESSEKMQEAVQKIMAFAKERGLANEQVRGKIIEYLKQTNSKHYQALIQAGVVKDF